MGLIDHVPTKTTNIQSMILRKLKYQEIKTYPSTISTYLVKPLLAILFVLIPGSFAPLMFEVLAWFKMLKSRPSGGN